MALFLLGIVIGIALTGITVSLYLDHYIETHNVHVVPSEAPDDKDDLYIDQHPYFQK